MRIFIIKPTGYSNDCPADCYTAIASTQPSVELSNRSKGSYGKGTVAAYSASPLGLCARVWGSKLLKGPLPELYREYNRLFFKVGIRPARAAWTTYLKILEEYNNSDKLERWVVFFK